MIPAQKKERVWNDPVEPRKINWRPIGFVALGFLITAAFFFILNGGKF